MSENATGTGALPARIYVRVARQAAALGVAAAEEAMNAVCRRRSGTTDRLEEAMHAAHREACAAERFAAWAQSWQADGTPERTLAGYAAHAVDAAVRAQAAAGVEITADALRAELRRPLTALERAERESARRREEARLEDEERAATGMDCDNRHLAGMNQYFAQESVAALGWTAGHLRVMEAAGSGRLYWRDGQARQARRAGEWEGGRRVSRERTQALFAARFLARARQDDGTLVLALSPTGRVALERVRLHPAGLYESDRAAYEARYARAARRRMTGEEKKAAARRLPPLDRSALRLYQRPVTLAEQEARAGQDAAGQWEDEGGYCPGAGTPRPAADAPPAPAVLAGRCDLCVHRQKGGPHVDDNIDWVRNHKGRVVAKLILRPGGEPCVWWCRCSCPKGDSTPDGQAGPVTAKPEAGESGRREARGSSRPRRKKEQLALF